MSTKKICTGCGGSGKYQVLERVTCPDCAGTGRNTGSDMWSEPCLKCNGSGEIVETNWKTCDRCSGSGYTNV